MKHLYNRTQFNIVDAIESLLVSWMLFISEVRMWRLREIQVEYVVPKIISLCLVLKPSPLEPQAGVLTIEPCQTSAFNIFCLTWIDRILIAGPILNSIPFKLGNYFLQEQPIIKLPFSPSSSHWDHHQQ